jgi:hypothetical protein
VGIKYPNMVNFGPRDTLPDKFKDRLFYQHNPTVTLMRTTAGENARIGEEIGRKVAASTGPATIMLPQKGVSAIDAAGEAFDDPDARAALFDAIRQNRCDVELLAAPHEIARRTKKTVVVVFDEFQQITQYDDDLTERQLRSSIQHHKNVAYLFLGSRKRLLQGMFLNVEFAETAARRLIKMMEGNHERIGPETKNEV